MKAISWSFTQKNVYIRKCNRFNAFLINNLGYNILYLLIF